jgi:hypothetical protein
MASFSAQPPAQCSAYRPVKYQVESSVVTDAVEKLRIRVYNADGDVLLAEYRKDWIVRVGSDPDYSYTFEFDIQGLMQSLLDPLPSALSGVFMDLTGFIAYAPGASISVYVKVVYEFRDSDNLLVAAEEDEITSNTITVFNLIQQHEELQGLSGYVTAGMRHLLTDIPDSTEIREGEAFNLAFVVNQNISRMIVTVDYKNGDTNSGIAGVNLDDYTSAHNKKVMVAGVGPRNLFLNTQWIGDPIVIDETVAAYEVAFANASNTRLTDSLRFVLIESCSHELRLHWMNDRGGCDAFTIDAKRRDVVEVKSNRAEKPLTWYAGGEVPHDRNQRGRFRLEVNRSDTWEVETRIEDESIAAWLAGLLASPEVYVEQPNKTYYLPAMVTDGKITTADNDEVGAIVKLTIEAANDRIVQRN